MDPRSLTGTSPRELLTVLSDGDPLDLALRCLLRRDERGVLVAPRRLLVRTIARCAFKGTHYRPDVPIEAWIRERIDESLDELVEEDEWGDRKGLPVEDPAHYELLTEVLGCDPVLARAVHARFHRLPGPVRRAYFAVAVRGESPQEYAERARRTVEAVHSDVSRAVSLILSATDGSEPGGAS